MKIKVCTCEQCKFVKNKKKNRKYKKKVKRWLNKKIRKGIPIYRNKQCKSCRLYRIFKQNSPFKTKTMKEIIQKNGKYWKECDIVMLPTEGVVKFSSGSSSLPANCKQYFFNGIVKGIEEFYPGNKQPNPNFNTLSLCGVEDKNANGYSEYMWQPQHLYLLSNEQIPYNPNGGTNGLFLCLHELQHPEDAIVKNVGNCTGCREIIASTDSGLTTINENWEGKWDNVNNFLPKPSEDFIKKYVESNGGIKKVLVEYEGIESIIEQRINTIHTFEYKLKLNPDNTISILLEDSVEEAAKQYAYSQYGNSCGAKEERKYCIEDFKAGAEWQRKNQLNN